MKKLHFSLTLIFLLLLTGCGTFEIIVETPVAFPPVFTDVQESTETSTPEPFNYDDLMATSVVDLPYSYADTETMLRPMCTTA